MMPVRRIRVMRVRSVTLALSMDPSPALVPPDTKDWTAPRTLMSAHKVRFSYITSRSSIKVFSTFIYFLRFDLLLYLNIFLVKCTSVDLNFNKITNCWMTFSYEVNKISNCKLVIADYVGINLVKMNQSIDHWLWIISIAVMLQLLSEIASRSIRIRFICFGQLLIRVSKVISV